MNKLSIFNPDAMVETRFAAERHSAAPRGEMRLPSGDELMLLHYKYLNFNRTLERHHAQSTGLGGVDRAYGWGSQYNWSADELRRQWAGFTARVVDIARADFEPCQSYETPRSWRFEGPQLTLLD